MDLPVIKIKAGGASDADLLRYYHKCEMAWSEAIAEQTELPYGTAYSNPHFDRVQDANRTLGVMLPDDESDADSCVDQIDAHFSAAGCKCLQWSMNVSAPPERTRPIMEALGRRGYYAGSRDVMHLTQSVDLRSDAPADLQIIPARASFRHVERSFQDAARDEWREPQLAGAMMQHLDDPRFDLLLALRDGAPVARGGVLAVGDIGMIKDIYVTPAARGSGLGRLMTLRCLEICARSLFRHVLLSVDASNTRAIALYTGLGFQKFGEFAWWAKRPVGDHDSRSFA